ncbi:hypothetical protein EBESD8_5670 [Rhodococcus aetherivorans]|nr:hypothetical protein EBESD8_5670 [Rhodococcus aetherivorans]
MRRTCARWAPAPAGDCIALVSRARETVCGRRPGESQAFEEAVVELQIVAVDEPDDMNVVGRSPG